MGTVNLKTASGGSVILSPANTASDVTITVPAVTAGMLTTATAGVPVNGPAFSAYQSVASSLVGGTYSKITFDVEEFDTNNCFASSRFTPTVAGYYQITGSLQTASSAVAAAAIYKNGSAHKTGIYSGTAFTNGIYPVTCLVYLNGTTDYVELYGYNGSTTQNTGAQSNITYFQAAMVRSA